MVAAITANNRRVMGVGVCLFSERFVVLAFIERLSLHINDKKLLETTSWELGTLRIIDTCVSRRLLHRVL
jgi:hypothetical protein